jgi:hypothetical protein
MFTDDSSEVTTLGMRSPLAPGPATRGTHRVVTRLAIVRTRSHSLQKLRTSRGGDIAESDRSVGTDLSSLSL